MLDIGIIASSLSLPTGEAFGNLSDFDFTTSQEFTFTNASVSGSGLGISFKTDGTKMFLANSNPNELVEYDLSTAWDITTASYSAKVTSPLQFRDLYIDSSGTRLFGNNSTTIYKHSLSTAWDITSLNSTADQQVTIGVGVLQSLAFSDDGLYFVGGSPQSPTIDGTQYIDPLVSAQLSTAWDLSSLPLVSSGNWNAISLKTLTGFNTVPNGLSIVNNGSTIIVNDNGKDRVYQFDLSTAYDVSTATQVDFEANNIGNSGSMTIRSDNPSEIYILGFGDKRVLQYSKT